MKIPMLECLWPTGRQKKIVRDTEIWRERYPWLIWSFWTQWQKRFFVPEYGLEDIEGQPLTIKIQDPTVKIQTYLH